MFDAILLDIDHTPRHVLRYWDFFPTEPGLGVVPVWGFANVEASNVDGVDVGSQVYGYLPRPPAT